MLMALSENRGDDAEADEDGGGGDEINSMGKQRGHKAGKVAMVSQHTKQ